MSEPFPHLGDDALHALSLVGTPIHIYSFGTRHHVWANEAGLDLWGARSLDELTARELTPFSASTQIRLEHYRAAFRRGEVFEENWTVYPKGKPTSAMSRCSGVSIDGHAEAMMVEMQISHSPSFAAGELRAIEALRHTPLKISLFSGEGEPLMRNPAAMAFFREFDDALGPGADAFRTMFADTSIADALRREVSGTGIASRTATIAIGDGPVHAIQISQANDPITGQPGLLVAQQDVSSIVQLTRRLAASEDAFAAALNLNVAPFVVLSVSNRQVLQANAAAQDLLGWSKLDDHEKLLPLADPADFERICTHFLSGSAAQIRFQLNLKGGRTFWVSAAGERITFEQRDAIAVLITDVDDLYRTAADLETALLSERTISQSQRHSMAIAAHEFRTPLAIIDGAVRRLERGSPPFSSEQLINNAARIRSAVKRLLNLIEYTVEHGREGSLPLRYSPAPCDLREIVVRVLSAFRDSRPEIVLNIDLPWLPVLNLDAALMEQAIANLIVNAIKFARDDTPVVDVSATVNSENVQLLIADHGIGIPPEERDGIFKPYVRGSNATPIDGTGLGLAIVRQIAEFHGGWIELVETDSPGSSFRLTLPRP